MRSWKLSEFHGPEAMVLEESESRPLVEGEARVRISACGINNKDLYISRGVYYRSISAPVVLGSDIAGTIIEVGETEEEIKVGERVLISPIIGCGSCKDCKEGKENNCPNSESILGGFSEEIIVPQENLIKIPEYLSDLEAASLPIAYLTAWNMLFNKARVAEGDTILLWGASSGVGSAALTLLESLDNIIAIAGGNEKIESLKKLGLKNVIDYRQGNINEKVMEMTDRKGVDVIFDPVGKAAWDGNLDLLKHNGRHVNCARNTGSDVNLDLGKVFSKQISILGAKSGSKRDLENILERLSRTRKKPIIDKVFEFEKAKEALTYLDRGEHFGKVILKI